MTKLPVVSGREAIRRFEKLGYVVVRQRGSHVRLHHADGSLHRPITIPDHPTLGRGLFRRLLRDAHVSIAEFVGLR
ncbi:type II toxin-antitoxin system HicA family toxin [Candidatus Peregrinibacteria bacterium]|nr:type II toxin-antitoxin system HicA family toxin [Candidatus Peregrinibacteria bacterium]